MSLGIEVIWNRPRRPTDNAKVERMQGVTATWSEPERRGSLEELQQHLDEVAAIQRSRYRCARLHNQTRIERYAALLDSGRDYDAAACNLAAVFSFLASGTWVRKVSAVGQIDFYHRRYSVGAQYRHQHLRIHLDAEQKQWVVRSDENVEVKRFSADFISQENIRGLSLCQ